MPCGQPKRALDLSEQHPGLAPGDVDDPLDLVPVDLRQHADVLVTEHVGNLLEGDPGFNQQGGSRVAQFVGRQMTHVGNRGPI